MLLLLSKIYRKAFSLFHLTLSENLYKFSGNFGGIEVNLHKTFNNRCKIEWPSQTSVLPEIVRTSMVKAYSFLLISGKYK